MPSKHKSVLTLHYQRNKTIENKSLPTHRKIKNKKRLTFIKDPILNSHLCVNNENHKLLKFILSKTKYDKA
jgi:hypothetical protein